MMLKGPAPSMQKLYRTRGLVLFPKEKLDINELLILARLNLKKMKYFFQTILTVP